MIMNNQLMPLAKNQWVNSNFANWFWGQKKIVSNNHWIPSKNALIIDGVVFLNNYICHKSIKYPHDYKSF